MTLMNDRIKALARQYGASELLAAAAARHAAEVLASGQTITANVIEDAVAQYRRLLHNALGAAE
jgi:hypothetical protein